VEIEGELGDSVGDGDGEPLAVDVAVVPLPELTTTTPEVTTAEVEITVP